MKFEQKPVTQTKKIDSKKPEIELNSSDVSIYECEKYLKTIDLSSDGNTKNVRKILEKISEFIYEHKNEIAAPASVWNDGVGKKQFLKIKNELSSFVNKDGNNYLSDLYIKHILETDGLTTFDKFQQIPTYFKIQPDQYMLNYGDRVSEKSEEVSNRIDDVSIEYKKWLNDSDNQEDLNMYRFDNDTDYEYAIEGKFKEKLNPHDFFLGQNHISNGEGKELMENYKYIMSTGSRELIEKDFKIDILKLSTPEQFQFLRFIEKKSIDNIGKVKNFVGSYGQDSLKTFLSLEHGGSEMGDKILTLGEKLPKESAEKLFAKYGEIVDEVDNIAEYLNKSLGEKANPEIIEEVKNNLLIKGKDLLARYAKDADVCKDQECADLGIELEEKLKDIKSSLLLLGSATKALVEQGQFDFKDFQDIEISYDTKPLDDKDKASIYAMSAVNTQQYPEKLREYWSGTLQKGLEDPTQGETVINVKFKGEIVSAMRVIPQSDGSYYGGSFNVNPNLQGSRIGTELLRQVIEEYTKRGDFNADCYENNPMLDVYTGKFGFKIVGEVENYHDTGAKVLNIKKEKTV